MATRVDPVTREASVTRVAPVNRVYVGGEGGGVGEGVVVNILLVLVCPLSKR